MTHFLQCANCNDRFVPNTHNQKYCSAECCRVATNRRIMQRYYERKRNRQGQARVCSYKGCATRLSRYNDEERCAVHARATQNGSLGVLQRLGAI